MATLSGHFTDQDISWLKSHQIEIRNALTAITLGQSYTISGRSVTQADYQTLADALAAVTFEIKRQDGIANGTPVAGSDSRIIYVNFRSVTSE